MASFTSFSFDDSLNVVAPVIPTALVPKVGDYAIFPLGEIYYKINKLINKLRILREDRLTNLTDQYQEFKDDCTYFISGAQTPL